MKDDLRNLVALQRLDEQLAVLRRRLESLPAELGERESDLAALEAAAEGLEGQRKAALVRAQELENEVLQMEERIRRLERQIRDSRDAGAIQVAEHEAGELRQRIARAQEEELSELDRAEALEKEVAASRERLDRAREELEQFRATVAEDEARLTAEAAGLQERRKTLSKSLPSPLRDVYEKLLPARRGRPLAALRGESCGGCGMVVPPNDRLLVQTAATLVRCRSCSRILVSLDLWTEESTAGGEAGAAAADS